MSSGSEPRGTSELGVARWIFKVYVFSDSWWKRTRWCPSCQKLNYLSGRPPPWLNFSSTSSLPPCATLICTLTDVSLPPRFTERKRNECRHNSVRGITRRGGGRRGGKKNNNTHARVHLKCINKNEKRRNERQRAECWGVRCLPLLILRHTTNSGGKLHPRFQLSSSFFLYLTNRPLEIYH